MIPSIFGDNLCSLVEGKDRLALTLWYNYITDTFYFEDSIIHVNKNYTYENYPVDNEMYEISQLIGKKYNMNLENWDTHKMIEAFMVLANNKTAEYLYTHKKPLYRVHTQKHHEIDLTKIENEKFRNFMKIYLSNSAEYTFNKGRHYGLNLDLYTHFTSPIRRMADVYVHYLIKERFEDIVFDLDKCNYDMKLTKKLKRDFDRMKVIQDLKETITTDGYIINFWNDKVTCYFPELNFCDKFDILPRGLNVVDDGELRKEQRLKIKILGNIRVSISKKENNLVYSF